LSGQIVKKIIDDEAGRITLFMFAANSLLFVPGTRPERFAKAKASGAGLTVIDLEDSVPPEEKHEARSAALAHIAQNSAGWGLRINALATTAGIRDLAALLDAATLPPVLLLPMVEAAAEVEIVAKLFGDRCPLLVPLVETPCGLRQAHAIAVAPRVGAIMFGGGDFAAELGVEMAWEPLLGARQALLLAAAEARVAAIDVPFVGLDDPDGLAAECGRARALGFAAKAAIHPAQVPVIERAFRPSAAQIAEAEAALAAFDAAGGRAVRHIGRMLEKPIIMKYRALLARSKGQIDA
jgi:(S)-citramalyl-CoA lyase